MKPIPERKRQRAEAKIEAKELLQVHDGLRNPPLELPKPEAATETPAQLARADKELLEKIKSGELVAVTPDRVKAEKAPAAAAAPTAPAAKTAASAASKVVWAKGQ